MIKLKKLCEVERSAVGDKKFAESIIDNLYITLMNTFWNTNYGGKIGNNNTFAVVFAASRPQSPAFKVHSVV